MNEPSRAVVDQSLIPALPAARRWPDLLPQHELFVIEYVANGGDRDQAMIDAGYSENSARQNAWRLLQRPEIAQAVMELTTIRLAMTAPAAAAQLDRLVSSARSEYVRLEASKDVLTRVGMAAPKRISLSGNVSVSYDLGEEGG